MIILSIALATLLLASCLILHEMGHWAVLSYLKVPVQEVGVGFGFQLFKIGKISFRLLPLGMYVMPVEAEFNKISPGWRLTTAAAGPLVNVVYGSIFWVLAKDHDMTIQDVKALALLSQLNFLLVFINILPIPPLDGWQILKEAAAYRGTPFSSLVQTWAWRIGNGLLWAAGLWSLFLAVPRH